MGFIGDKCEVDINECDSDPCFNGATCNDLIDGFSCSCLPGFKGKSNFINGRIFFFLKCLKSELKLMENCNIYKF